VLRVYEGCARALLGEVEGANVLKLHRYSGKVTYLVCPRLDRDPEPGLELRIKVTLPTLAIGTFDYSRREEQPRLGVGGLHSSRSRCQLRQVEAEVVPASHCTRSIPARNPEAVASAGKLTVPFRPGRPTPALGCERPALPPAW
jgi:hypothetical protein